MQHECIRAFSRVSLHETSQVGNVENNIHCNGTTLILVKPDVVVNAGAFPLDIDKDSSQQYTCQIGNLGCATVATEITSENVVELAYNLVILELQNMSVTEQHSMLWKE
jgi:hypothetical protein